MSNFTHLHVHTEYSLLDGFVKLDEVFDRLKELKMDSIAITDHGTMFGVVEFYKKAKQNNINPIIGCEVYTANRKMTDKSPVNDKKSGHLILLVKNLKGYENLIKLVSESFKKGYYYKPRIDYELLKKHSEGLIALSACLAGEISQNILLNRLDMAKKKIMDLKDIFKDDFYLELQDHGLEDQRKVNRQLIKFSRELEVKLVATNDVHYLNKEDSMIHDVLLCIQTGKILNEEKRLKFPNDEFYLKSYEEMYEIFENVDNCLSNTQEIVEKCTFEFDFSQLHLPEYKLERNLSSEEYLKYLCTQGLKKRYPRITNQLSQRLEDELDVIIQMGYEDYFLIVWDFIKYAKENGIFVGPGRGSAGGSLVAYVLEITDVDPIEYGLIFERFLNPERITMPDIDIDFEDGRRQEVIDYVIDKYGKNNVAQIITFGTMAARAAIRDVGRVLDISYGKVDRIAKMINRRHSVKEALEKNDALKDAYYKDKEIKRLLEYASRVEGVPRHASTHAAGVVISKNTVDSYVPLYVHNDDISTQYSMEILEELGLLKMDFLGLRNLTIIKNALKIIKKKYQQTIDIQSLPLNDRETYELISSGNTLGVFQLESVGMRRFMKKLKPKTLEDIIAGISLYRPGPMESIPKYIENRQSKKPIEYLHPKLEPILNVTDGILIYQEQVMEIVRKLAGYSYGRSDLVRRAMSKKKLDVMEKERKIFIYGQEDDEENIIVDGCIRRGVSEKIANIIFDDMIDFAKYAFNKAHAAGYALIAYQTAYLKTHYPVAFMAALMTSVMGNHSKLRQYIQNAKEMNIEVLPPSINYSFKNFAVDQDKIRFGLLAVKNVGHGIIREIVKRRREQKYDEFIDFCEKISSRELNKKAVESLIKAGAFDEFKLHRSQLLAIYEKVIDSVHNNSKQNIKGQGSLFDFKREVIPNKIINYDLPDIDELRDDILLKFEKEMLGIYLSMHPFGKWREQLDQFNIPNVGDFVDSVRGKDELENKVEVIGGMISRYEKKITKNSNEMAFLSIEDLSGEIDIIVFPRSFHRFKNILKPGQPILVKGKLNYNESEIPKVIAVKIKKMTEQLINEMKEVRKKLYLRLSEYDHEVYEKVKKILRKYPGTHKVVLYFENENKKVMMKKKYSVTYSDNINKELTDIIGKNNVKYC